MAFRRLIKTNFTSGEIDERARMRTELAAYANGASKMRNVIPFPQGGFRRRDGLEFMERIPPAGDEFQISSLILDDGGTGYTVNDTLTVVGGTGTAATLNVDAVSLGVITAISIVTKGVYSAAPASPNSPSGGTGTGASVVFNVISIFQVKPIGIVDIEINSGGTGYAVDDDLTLSGGTGTSAKLRVESVSAGVITGIILIDSGDYTVAPSSPAGHTGGTGTGATFNFTDETQIVIFPTDFTFSINQNYLIVFTVSRFYIFREENTGSGPRQLVEQGLHPYSNTELEEITWTQSLDVMLIFHDNHPIFQLTRTAEAVWTWDTFSISNTPSFAFGVIQTGTLDVPTTSSTKVGDILVGLISSVATFSAASVGKFIRVGGSGSGEEGDTTSFYKITTFNSPTSVDAEVLVNPIVVASFTVNAVQWLLEEPEWSQEHGYPRAGTFFQGRLCVLGSKDGPAKLWTSRAGDINDFNNGGVADDLGIVVEADAGTVVTFQNIYPGRHLQLFADSGEFYIPISEFEPITPTNISLRRTTSNGSIPGIPVFEVDGVVYYLQRGNETLRNFVFTDNERAYSSDVVSLFSSPLLRNPRDAAFKELLNTEDSNYIWFPNRDDGSLAVFCLLRSQEINAWSLGTTKGAFHHVAVLSQTTYFHNVRFIDGETVDYIEFFNKDLRFDSGVIAIDLLSSVTVVSGLDHLEGEEVGVIIDGSIFGNQTVSDGFITLSPPAEDSYQIGLPFPDIEGEAAGVNVLVETLPSDFLITGQGTTMDLLKRVISCSVAFVDTQGFYLQNIQVIFRDLPDIIDTPIPFQTGQKRLDGLLGWDRLGQVKITQKEPTAMTVLGLAYDLRTER